MSKILMPNSVWIIVFLLQNLLPQSQKNNIYNSDGRYDKKDKTLKHAYQIGLTGYNGNQKEIVMRFLTENKNKFNIEDMGNLILYEVNKSSLGNNFIFNQRYRGVEVDNSGITVSISNKNEIISIVNNTHSQINLSNISPGISSGIAISKAKEFVDCIEIDSNVTPKIKLVIYRDANDRDYLSWKINLVSKNPIGKWIIYVDALNGAKIKVIDNRLFYENGQGKVFKPDPITALQNSSLGDQNNTNYLDIQSAYQTVQLRDLDDPNENNYYFVKGRYVKSIDFTAPNNPVVSKKNSTIFEYDRSQNGFEEVNAYYFIDDFRRYIATLNINPLFYGSEFINIDAHGDESYYSPGLGISYDTYCVDDAEDLSVVIHEYSHAIQDALMPDGLNGTYYFSTSISEGSADYKALSYRKTFSSFLPNQIFPWDGNPNDCTAGRYLPANYLYPNQWTGQGEHISGSHWAKILMDIENIPSVGRNVTNKILLSSFSLVHYSDLVPDFVYAILSTDELLYNSIHVKEIGQVFYNNGFFDSMEGVHESNYLSGTYGDEEDVQLFWGGMKWVNANVTLVNNHTFNIPSNGFLFIGPGKTLTITGSSQLTVSSGAVVVNYNASGTPANFHFTSSSGNVQLAWNANSQNEFDFKHYEIQRKTDEDNHWSTIATITSRTTTTYTDNNYSIDPEGGLVIYYRIRAVNTSNNYSSYSSTISSNGYFNDSKEYSNNNKHKEIVKYNIEQNYPNPFNPTTSITYSIEQNVNVKIDVYNIFGQLVSTIINKHHSPGIYTASFDGADYASGIYFYKIEAGNFREIRRMVLLK